MQYNVLLVGVGGQGILTIAQAISRAALRRGYNVKQSEVHGMSQRGGAVQAHLRFSDQELHSDLIPLGRADLLLAVEPLEVARYVEYLGAHSVIVSNSVPVVNIPNYPPVEEVLAEVARLGDHILIDAQRLARSAGSARAENMVILGAASLFLDFGAKEFEELIAEAFARKGPRVVEVNHRAFRYGRHAASLYRDALRRGGTGQAVRRWVESVEPEELARLESPDPAAIGLAAASSELTSAEARAIGQILERVRDDGRTQLFEHEVYSIVELAGAITPPRHRFVEVGETLSRDDVAAFPGDRVVVKIVSPDIVHKTEAGGVSFVAKSADEVNREMKRLAARHGQDGKRIDGTLVVEFVEQAGRGTGDELFVGIRQTREFGPVIAAGLGGVATEFLSSKMLPGIGVAKAAALDTTPEEFFETFRSTAAYELLAGTVRGHDRVVGDGELIRCFRAFLAIARACCIADEEGLCLEELEVNPFAFRQKLMVPLDGRARLGQPITASAARPIEKTRRLLEPRSIAVLGVSTKRANFGRIILNNIKDCGFPTDRLCVIKSGEDTVDGVRCIGSLHDLAHPVDLLVAAIGAEHIPPLVDELLEWERAGRGRCASVILIPGGLGETSGTEGIQERIREAIAAHRRNGYGGPVFLGGNSMGVRSRPGSYDTFFIPADKLDPRRRVPPKRAALVSQSGAFIITRMSNLQYLDPTLAISIGNQVDLTVSDLLLAVAQRDDVDCIGVYIEGFNDLDGLAFIRAVQRATGSGKIVVFYKAGRTSAGRSAAKGHTASLAGDYDICQAAVAAARAIVTDTFKEFEQLMELGTDLHVKRIHGTRIGAVSNAGYESVGMADTVKGVRYQVDVPALSEEARKRLADALADHGLAALVNAANPLDLTPMADDDAYEACIKVMLEADELDALIVGCVPMTPQLLSTPSEIDRPDSIARRLPRLFAESQKPLIVVVDCAEPYDELARAIRSAGVPVFRSADQAVRSLGRYLCHRAPSNREPEHLSTKKKGDAVAEVPEQETLPALK